jgi:hypothetical protein
MRRFWRGLVMFLLGTGFGVALGERFGVLISPADLMSVQR